MNAQDYVARAAQTYVEKLQEDDQKGRKSLAFAFFCVGIENDLAAGKITEADVTDRLYQAYQKAKELS